MKRSLYFKDSVSDKEYHVEMVAQSGGYVVNISYGRVGSKLQSGTKTSSPVSKLEAEKLMKSVVNSKIAKGYVLLGALASATQPAKKGIAPMLCTKMLPTEAENLSDEWVIEKKFDGVRATIKDGQLFCRRGNNITGRFPEFTNIDKLKQSYDGEIIAVSLRSKKSPAIFMAFDLPDAQGDNEARREMLEQTKCPKWMDICEQFDMSHFTGLWEEVLKNTDEGVVVKRKDTMYVNGARSNGWKKVKAFLETTATFVSYEEHPRGIKMETADGRTVNVNGEQAKGVKATIDTQGSVKAEIQYLPQKDSDAWRFPSFRGAV